MVTQLDRLARSTRDLLNTLAAITGKNAGFRSLGPTGPGYRSVKA
jgi:DNA invertase Pin-like site-specific DNA recombinase